MRIAQFKIIFLCLLCVLTLTLLSSCGYSLGYRTPPDVYTIGVPIFHNSTFGLRREIEYDLTSLVRQEIQTRTSLRVVSTEKADMILRGNIVVFRENLIVQGDRNNKVESNVFAVVDVILEDYVNGSKMTMRVNDNEPFSPVLGEEFQTGRNRALKNLAERIVARIEYWDDYEESS